GEEALRGALRRLARVDAGDARGEPARDGVSDGVGPLGEVEGRGAARAGEDGLVAGADGRALAVGVAEVEHEHVHADAPGDGPEPPADADGTRVRERPREPVAVAARDDGDARRPLGRPRPPVRDGLAGPDRLDVDDPAY